MKAEDPTDDGYPKDLSFSDRSSQNPSERKNTARRRSSDAEEKKKETPLEWQWLLTMLHWRLARGKESFASLLDSAAATTKDSSKSGEDKSMVAADDLEEREEKWSCRSFGKREEMLVIWLEGMMPRVVMILSSDRGDEDREKMLLEIDDDGDDQREERRWSWCWWSRQGQQHSKKTKDGAGGDEDRKRVTGEGAAGYQS